MTQTKRTAKTATETAAATATFFEPMVKTVQVATDSALDTVAATGNLAIVSMRAGLSLQEEALKTAFTAVSGAERANQAMNDAARGMATAAIQAGADFEFPFKREIEQWNELAMDTFRKNMELFAFPMNQFGK